MKTQIRYSFENFPTSFNRFLFFCVCVELFFLFTYGERKFEKIVRQDIQERDTRNAI